MAYIWKVAFLALLYATTALGTTFGPQQILGSQSGANKTLAIDLVGDSKLEILGGSQFGAYLVYYQKMGPGYAQHDISGGKQGLVALTAGDLNQDGMNDVVSASSDNTVYSHENDGAGIFNITTVGPCAACLAVVLSDVDRDGCLDILSASASDGIRLYIGSCTGTFSSGVLIHSTGLFTDVRSVDTGDLNGDSFPDVLVSARIGGVPHLVWFENSGTSFLAHTTISINGTFVSSQDSIIVADLDNDFFPDIIAADITTNRIDYLRNTEGVFANPTTLASNVDTRALFVTDLNGDGWKDVLSTGFTADNIVWYENLGTGSFGPRQIITILTDGPRGVFAADLNEDGYLDVIAAAGGQLAWYPQIAPTLNPTLDPTSEPTAPHTVSPTQVATAPPTQVATASPKTETVSPTQIETAPDTVSPTQVATAPPTQVATAPPTQVDTVSPTQVATAPPTQVATAPPTQESTLSPTQAETASPTLEPSAAPTPGCSPTDCDDYSCTTCSNGVCIFDEGNCGSCKNDDEHWTDKNSKMCTAYEKDPTLCDVAATNAASNGRHAGNMCCVCGGGGTDYCYETYRLMTEHVTNPACDLNVTTTESNLFGVGASGIFTSLKGMGAMAPHGRSVYFNPTATPKLYLFYAHSQYNNTAGESINGWVIHNSFEDENHPYTVGHYDPQPQDKIMYGSELTGIWRKGAGGQPTQLTFACVNL